MRLVHQPQSLKFTWPELAIVLNGGYELFSNCQADRREHLHPIVFVLDIVVELHEIGDALNKVIHFDAILLLFKIVDKQVHQRTHERRHLFLVFLAIFLDHFASDFAKHL